MVEFENNFNSFSIIHDKGHLMKILCQSAISSEKRVVYAYEMWNSRQNYMPKKAFHVSQNVLNKNFYLSPTEHKFNSMF